MMKKLSLLLTLFSLISNFSFAQDAIYKIVFISNWSSTTHPDDFPTGSDHWSPLIGTTHKDATPFFQLGQIASDGVEQVAETGGTSIITEEINIIIASGNAYEIINGSGLGSGLGTITINDVGVDGNFPYISLITMIAPSPDWVAQINNLKLTDNSNNWQTSISIDVYATDVGTDNGVTYASENNDTNPRENLTSLENTFPFSDQIIGTFVFTLEQVLSINEEILNNAILIYPNPTKRKVNIKKTENVLLETVEVYAVNGKKLKTFTNLNNDLVFDSLTSGLYFLKFFSNKGILTKKLIIQ